MGSGCEEAAVPSLPRQASPVYSTAGEKSGAGQGQPSSGQNFAGEIPPRQVAAAAARRTKLLGRESRQRLHREPALAQGKPLRKKNPVCKGDRKILALETSRCSDKGAREKIRYIAFTSEGVPRRSPAARCPLPAQ